MKTILITGAAGFIGSSLIQKLLKRDTAIIGIDNLTDNYDPKFKKNNLTNLMDYKNFRFHKIDILNNMQMERIFQRYRPHVVIHLAALTGIRSSLKKLKLYEQVNIIGTKNIYDLAYKYQAKKFIFSSSSSVYGNSKKIPFTETQRLFPRSPYAKTKKFAEILLQKLQVKNKIPTIIFRFFSVYGPKGRPDMAPYLFTKAAIKQKPIIQYGNGNSARDYTYIDDIIEAINIAIFQKLNNQIINLGNSTPIKLCELITIIEKITKSKIKLKIQPLNKVESLITYANIEKAKQILNWKPKTKFETGMNKFYKWFLLNRAK